jgi:hypothetical protein
LKIKKSWCCYDRAFESFTCDELQEGAPGFKFLELGALYSSIAFNYEHVSDYPAIS